MLANLLRQGFSTSQVALRTKACQFLETLYWHFTFELQQQSVHGLSGEGLSSAKVLQQFVRLWIPDFSEFSLNGFGDDFKMTG